MSASAESASEQYDRLARSGCFVRAIVAGRPLVPDPHILYEDEAIIAFLNQFPTQEGYTLVCPKRHIERFEQELPAAEWLHLQGVVLRVARAVAAATDPLRMYIAALGSPERNPHLHVHVCPCPRGTPFDGQQFAAMQWQGGHWKEISPARMAELAASIRAHLGALM